MNLLTPGVVQGLTEANLYTKYADGAIGVYKRAKAEGDEAVMERALGQAVACRNSASESSKKAQEALKEAQKEAREQAKAEQEAALEKRHQEAAQDKKEQQETLRKPTNADTVEISKEGQTKIKDKNYAESDESEQNTTAIVDNTDVLLESVEVATAKGTYTPQGEVKPLSIDHKLSVTV